MQTRNGKDSLLMLLRQSNDLSEDRSSQKILARSTKQAGKKEGDWEKPTCRSEYKKKLHLLSALSEAEVSQKISFPFRRKIQSTKEKQGKLYQIASVSKWQQSELVISFKESSCKSAKYHHQILNIQVHNLYQRISLLYNQTENINQTFNDSP